MMKTNCYAINILFITLISYNLNFALKNTDYNNFIIRTPDSSEIKVIIDENDMHQFKNYRQKEMTDIRQAIKDYEKQNQANQKKISDQFIQEFNITIGSKIKISATLFDRDSDTLIVAGQSFNHNKKSVYALASIYPNFDIITFNYRWTSLWSFFCRLSSICNPIQELFLNEHEEITTIVNYIKKKKDYTSIIGHALCYSTYPFLEAQVKSLESEKPLFDKLILDSAFSTIDDVLDKITEKPFLICNSQMNLTPPWLQTLLNYLYIPKFIRFLLPKHPQTSIPSLLTAIKDTPIMLIHGKDDILVPLNETFENIWNAASKTIRFAYFTPYEHVMNLSKNRGLYKKICELFIKCSAEEFPCHFPLCLETFD